MCCQFQWFTFQSGILILSSLDMFHLDQLHDNYKPKIKQQ